MVIFHCRTLDLHVRCFAWKKYKTFSQMVVKDGDESHGIPIRKKKRIKVQARAASYLFAEFHPPDASKI